MNSRWRKNNLNNHLFEKVFVSLLSYPQNRDLCVFFLRNEIYPFGLPFYLFTKMLDSDIVLVKFLKRLYSLSIYIKIYIKYLYNK